MKVMFFGHIKEVLGVAQLDIPERCENVAQLRKKLQAKGDVWQQYLAAERSLVAVNHELTDNDCMLSATDEIAFFPPVTGG